jgi:hypothetical protein
MNVIHVVPMCCDDNFGADRDQLVVELGMSTNG